MNLVGKLSVKYSEKPIIRSLLQLLPGWGSADELLQQRANEIREERVRAFFDELATLEHELTEELINSENFLHCYFSTMKAVIGTRRREKIQLFAKLFKNSIISKQNDIDTNDIDTYDEELRMLDEMSFREIQMLYIIDKHHTWDHVMIEQNPESSDSKYKLSISEEEFTKRNEALKNIISSELNVERNLVDGMLIRLTRTGLLERVTSFTDIEDRDYILGPVDCLRLSPLYYKIKQAVEISA